MCLVSKWCEKLWTHAPSLNFSSNEIDDLISVDYQEDSESSEIDFDFKFKLFVDSVLNHREISQLHKFSLQWDSATSEITERWLCHVIKSNPRVISLDIWGDKELNVPDTIFTCQSLEELYLNL